LVNTGNFGNKGKEFGDFNVSFTFDAVGLSCASGTAEIKDLFKGKTLGVFSTDGGGGFWSEVDESTMLMLRASCVKKL
jgi:hypothetical protein